MLETSAPPLATRLPRWMAALGPGFATRLTIRAPLSLRAAGRMGCPPIAFRPPPVPATRPRACRRAATLCPLLVFPEADLGTEIIFGACLVAALGAVASWMKTPRPARALGVGLALGLATLAQTSAALLPAAVAAWAWIPLGLTVAARDRGRQMLLLAFGLLTVLSPGPCAT